MKPSAAILSAALLLIGNLHGFAQGFINLKYESATFVSDPSSIYYPMAVYANTAVPGWTPYISGIAQTTIWSNGVSLGAPAISIQGTNSIYAPIQGKYFILLQGEGNFGTVPNTTNSAAIGQTGQIPLSAQSLTFWGLSSYYSGGPFVGTNTSILLAFNGNLLPFGIIGNTGSYNIYGADISPYAGQTGELLFTAPYNTIGYIDNIQFSSTPLPEPGTLALTALGTLLLGYRRAKT